MKTLARFSLLAPHSTALALALALGLAAVASSAACHGGELDVGSANGAAEAGVGSGASADGGRTLPEGVLAQFEGKISGIAVDASQVYLAAEEGWVYVVPKNGGAPRKLTEDASAQCSSSSKIAVDDTHVYFSSIDFRRVVRVSKAGGVAETVADNVGFTADLVVDATHVYIGAEDNFVPGSPTGPAVLRAPKGGGQVEVVASAQPMISALALAGDDLYFAGGFHSPTGAIRRVPKAGGEVTTLVSPLDTRPPPGNFHSSGTATSLQFFGDRLAFLLNDQLTFAPRAGGATTPSGLTVGDFVVDGSSLVIASLDPASSEATLRRLDASGAEEKVLSRWSYPKTENVMASVAAATAIVSDGERVFWVDFDNHTASTTEPLRMTLRVAALR